MKSMIAIKNRKEKKFRFNYTEKGKPKYNKREDL